MTVAVIIISGSLVLLLIFAIVHRSVFPCMEGERIRRKLQKDGIEAEAILLCMERTGFYMNKLPQVKMHMKVQLKNGLRFVSDTREALSPVDLAQLSVGCTIKVKYNPHNMKEVMLVR